MWGTEEIFHWFKNCSVKTRVECERSFLILWGLCKVADLKNKLLLGVAGFLWCKERPHMLRNGWIRSEGWNGFQLVKMHRWYIFQHQIGHRLNREKVKKKKKRIDTIIGCHITYFANPTGSIAWHPKRPLPKRLRPRPHEDDCKRKR